MLLSKAAYKRGIQQSDSSKQAITRGAKIHCLEEYSQEQSRKSELVRNEHRRKERFNNSPT